MQPLKAEIKLPWAVAEFWMLGSLSPSGPASQHPQRNLSGPFWRQSAVLGALVVQSRQFLPATMRSRNMFKKGNSQILRRPNAKPGIWIGTFTTNFSTTSHMLTFDILTQVCVCVCVIPGGICLLERVSSAPHLCCQAWDSERLWMASAAMGFSAQNFGRRGWESDSFLKVSHQETEFPDLANRPSHQSYGVPCATV